MRGAGHVKLCVGTAAEFGVFRKMDGKVLFLLALLIKWQWGVRVTDDAVREWPSWLMLETFSGFEVVNERVSASR